MTADEKAKHDGEYQSLLALYIALLRSRKDSGNINEALYELSELRTEYAVNHVLEGLDVDYEYAMQLLINAEDNSLTQHDKDMRDRIKAAILNLIDFSVCEEYQLYLEAMEAIGDNDIEYDSDEYEELLLLCEKYNDSYAAVENGDIKYAGAVAAAWLRFSAADYLVYWTQNDFKVRPWHMALQGYAAHPEEFPSWMIPPIEYNCRCFLEQLIIAGDKQDVRSIKGSIKNVKKPSQLSDVYSESLAKCGRIFEPSHNYFNVNEADKEMLEGFVQKLRSKYHCQ